MLYDYITKERPKVKINTIFLLSLAPYKKLTDHSSIYHIIKITLNEVKITVDKRVLGTTLFRHNAASHFLKNSVEQSTIAAVLGHTNQDTTSIYITTNEEELRKCMILCQIFLKEDYNMKEIFESNIGDKISSFI